MKWTSYVQKEYLCHGSPKKKKFTSLFSFGVTRWQNARSRAMSARKGEQHFCGSKRKSKSEKPFA